MLKNFEKESLTKIETSFGIITNDKNYEIVTEKLKIKPTRFRQKGEKTFNKFSTHPAVAKYGIWEISKTTIGEEVSLTEHTQHFYNLLNNKLEIIEELKEQYGFECVFYVLVTTEYGQFGFDLDEDTLGFLKEISNRFTFSCVCVEQLKT